jgi:hypothetical protein
VRSLRWALVGLGALGALLVLMCLVAFAALPYAFLVGLLRGRWARAGAVSALVERLGGARQHLRGDLAEALGDPGLDLAYRLPREGRWVDARGHPSALPAGLQGLADHVAGLDGRLDVLSPPGGGTLVRARIPCASS